jgi:hypothetical protein
MAAHAEVGVIGTGDDAAKCADDTGSVAGQNRAFGVWGTIGMSHRWGEAVIMW